MDWLNVVGIVVAVAVIAAGIIGIVLLLKKHLRNARLYMAADIIRLAYRVHHQLGDHGVMETAPTESELADLRWALQTIDEARDADVELAFDVIDTWYEERWARRVTWRDDADVTVGFSE